MKKALNFTNVSKHYKDFSLKNITFSLDKGYIMGFIGPNGAGKSTTIKLMMNLIKKDSGKIKIFGLDHEKNEIAIKERIGFVYDENHFYEELTVQEMKDLIRPLYKKWDDGLFARYIKEFNIPIKKKIKHLSKGMKIKFSLATAFSHHADLLIMDEPTSGLDPVIRNEILDLLQSLLQDENKSVFFSTHITSDLEKVADFITIINQGEILLNKSKDELLEEYCIVKGSKELLNSNQQQFTGLKKNKYGFEALANNKQEIAEQFGNSVAIEKPTLDDILFFLTRKGEDRVSSY